ncbi:MAG: cation transporter [Christensenellaceae bacterium]|nr:cation transporter [Christensenellaceae bacterium]
MLTLIKRLLKPGESPEQPAVRRRLGTLGSGVGIAVNVLLSALKLLVGTLSGSLAVTADAANNLSDAAGSIVSLVTIRMAQKPVDREHPFGHGRLEYLGALGVGVLILLMGLELLMSGVRGIFQPSAQSFSWALFAILIVSILLKLLLYRFYDALGRFINASALRAAAKDSLSDVLATSAVTASMLIVRFAGWPVDGWMGTLVALLVLKAGWEVCRDTFDRLLGGKPNHELGRQLLAMLEERDGILGTHDLILHDYGPGRCFASVHAEVPADANLIELHEVIDEAERDIGEKLGIPVCIHMDPVITGDEQADQAAAYLTACLMRCGDFQLHDLRRVPYADHTDLIFDVSIPADFRDTAGLQQRLEDAARELDPRCRCRIHFDIDYYHHTSDDV